MDAAPPLSRLHSVTAIASGAQASVDFYTKALGLHLVKVTVQTGDAPAYRLWLSADEAGSPGGLLSLLVWPKAPKGRWGLGTTHHVAWLCADATAQDRWKRRLTDRGLEVTGPYDRHYFRSIYLTDPDGLILEIATAGPGFTVDEPPDELGSRLVLPPEPLTRGHRDEQAIAAHTWPEPVDGIDEHMRLRHLHHVTCISHDDQVTDRFFTDVLGLRRVKATVNFDNADASHLYYANTDAEPGSTITFFGYTPDTMRPGRLGTGLVHHLAFACSGDDELSSWRRRLRSAGRAVSEVTDATYFRSISFADPSGLLLEVATPGPGFAVDEDAGTLGSRLVLPADLESRRAEIESALEPLEEIR